MRFYVRSGRPNSSLLAEFLLNGEILARRVFEQTDQGDADQQFPPALETNQPLLLSIGSSSMGVAEAMGGRQYAADGRPVVVALPTIEGLPPDWYGYEGVDMVIVSTSHESVDGKLAADAPQIEALETWVRLGGKLLLCGGSRAERIAAARVALVTVSPWPATGRW